jgi:ABC-type transport system involved in cytochrome c biogenesis ATPase subunit
MDILYFLPHLLQQKNIKTILEQLAFYKKSHKNQTHYQLWQEGLKKTTR